VPTIRIEPPKDLLESVSSSRTRHQYELAGLHEPNGRERVLRDVLQDLKAPANWRCADCGDRAGDGRRESRSFISASISPEEYVAEAVQGVSKKTGSIENLRILLARAEQARTFCPRNWRSWARSWMKPSAYRTVPETEDVSGGLARFRAEGADLITFTSSSTVENFLALKLPLPTGLRPRHRSSDLKKPCASMV